MNVLITGASGFLGNQLAHTLLDQGHLCGAEIDSLTLTDRVASNNQALLADKRVREQTGDLLNALPTLFDHTFDVVFHLASAVSGECEADFSLGLRANLATTETLLAHLRAQSENLGQAPKLFFSSSVAVFGGDAGIAMPTVITDATLPVPQSSYGIQKFMCEQLIADYTRKGIIDGRVARLMTVSVRPGRPNGAASGFLSGIIREPLAGVQAICPVDPSTMIALASPRNTIAGILSVTQSSKEALAGRTAINLPALTVSVAQMMQALRHVAGEKVAALVRFEPDASIARLIGSWPAHFNCQRTQSLGLIADPSYENIIEQYISDQGI